MSDMVDGARRDTLLKEIRNLAEVASSTNYTRIHGLIRRDIILGKFESGERLKTSDLSARYKLSPVPIREALQKLAGEGLVYFSPNKGVSVRGVDADFIREIHELRALVASHLTRQSVDLMTDEAIADLVAIEDIFREMLAEDDSHMVILTNRFLHNTLDQFAKNEVMKRMLTTHFELLEVLRSAVGYSAERSTEMQDDHQDLIEACRNRDGDRAAMIMARHVGSAQDDYLKDILAIVSKHNNTSRRHRAGAD